MEQAKRSEAANTGRKAGVACWKKNNSLNLLSFMESAIEYDFPVLEEFLKEKKPVLDKKDGSLTIGDTKFGKIVL